MRGQQRFRRTYGSVERVKWMRDHNCAACGRSPCEVAHIRGGGVGRKADYRHTIPLCPMCHREQHSMGIKSFAQKYYLDLDALAAEWEARWQAHKGGDTDLGF